MMARSASRPVVPVAHCATRVTVATTAADRDESQRRPVPDLVAGCQRVFRYTPVPFAQRDPQLAARQVGSRHRCCAAAEGQMAVSGAIESDRERVGEFGGIQIRLRRG